MSLSYSVTKRGPKGEPLEIHCDAHPDCSWRMQSTGRKPDDDPILRAQWAHHMKESLTPDAKSFGHIRRRR